MSVVQLPRVWIRGGGNQRKYSSRGISELERIFLEAKAGNDVATLEELEEELSQRATQRAKKLLLQVRKCLSGNDDNPTANISGQVVPETDRKAVEVVEQDKIDWSSVLSGAAEVAVNADDDTPVKSPSNRPENIIDAWTTLEVLTPQTYKKPDDLVTVGGSVAYLKHGEEPWIKGEVSEPKHNLYYVVYIGAVNLKSATKTLLAHFKDRPIEHPPDNGFAPLGAVLLDKKGIPEPKAGLVLSSFGWAFGQVIRDNLHLLKYWEEAEDQLKNGLEHIIDERDAKGEVLPFSLAKANQAFEWLYKNCDIPDKYVKAPSFSIRLSQRASRGKPEPPLLNSFYLDDLQLAKAKLETNTTSGALSQYMGVTKSQSPHDVLKDKSHIENALQPEHMPLGRWPGKGRHPLVLLQQTAVNLAMQLQGSELLSVNGPPGTGKTTLLRDIVAGVLVKRAKALYAFKDTGDAFEYSGLDEKLDGTYVKIYELNETLRGHEMVVASTNNKAVENVSRELPLSAQVADDLDELNYFKTVSDALSGKQGETWGLIAAVLGNSMNKKTYINKAWLDQNSGLKKYFLSITRQVDYEDDENGNPIIPNVVKECDPPENLEEAKERWVLARRRFAQALKKAEKVTLDSQKVYKWRKQIYEMQDQLNQIKKEKRAQQRKLKKLSAQDVQPKADLRRIETRVSAEAVAEYSKAKEPGSSKRSYANDKGRNGIQRIDLTKQDIAKLTSKQKTIEAKIETVRAQLKNAAEICEEKLVTPSLWGKSHEDQQLFSPNFTPDAHEIRDEVFVEAIRLHKAFIDASAKEMQQNLAVFFKRLSGIRSPRDKRFLLPHLWSSFFLLTPVISTTFASVSRMFKELPPESIGWLLIDEAGQATPQATIGAMLRTQRVISVGDPLQIEPVVTLPEKLVKAVASYYGVNPDRWMAPEASVQTVSDVANQYGTTIERGLGDIRIGMPLLVHRRCENPMFTISNKLAYDGQMVKATIDCDSDITSLFGTQSKWFHVQGRAKEKWCPEEGEFVAKKLLEACSKLGGDPGIFVISPFRIVADEMQRLMFKKESILRSYGIDDLEVWIKENIGTVHTFQGKEAKAVILLLGAPAKEQQGARNWAASYKENLLNVAVSRAKQNFYVVGNKNHWGGLRHMQLVSRYLSRKKI